jgi:hypothetical protein
MEAMLFKNHIPQVSGNLLRERLSQLGRKLIGLHSIHAAFQSKSHSHNYIVILKSSQFIFGNNTKKKRILKSCQLFLGFLQIFLDICRPITYNDFNRYDHATECAGNRFERGSSAHAFVRPYIAKSDAWEYNINSGTYFSVKYYFVRSAAQ